LAIGGSATISNTLVRVVMYVMNGRTLSDNCKVSHYSERVTELYCHDRPADRQ